MKHITKENTPSCSMFYVPCSTRQGGFIISIVTFFVLIIMLSIAISMSTFVFYRQKIATNANLSTQSYYAAESGIEDALLRLRNDPNTASTSYNINIGNASAIVTIPAIIASSRSVSSEATNVNIKRKIQAVVSLGSGGAAFHYGVQAGGGFSLGSGSEVLGNVFTNGDISNPNASATIDNSVVVAGTHTISGHNNGNKIIIKGDVETYGCSFATITGSLTITGGSNSCGSSSSGSEVTNEPLPILQSQIDDWKSSASSACNSADVSTLAGNNNQVSLGSCKITGDLTVGNGSTLTMTGDIYVTGNVTFSNKSTLLLASSFGASSGVIIADGIITVSNSVTVKSLGQTGSNIILLSTNSSSTAINIQNGGTVDGATLYASAGGISLNNNTHLHQIAAAGTISLSNNILLQYDVGLVYNFFSGGPGGSLKVASWQEQ